MSRKTKEDSKGILDDYLENPNSKLIYNSLLKFGPLTLGEIHFITQLDKDVSTKTIKSLIENNLIQLVKDPQEMYIALPPYTLFSAKLDALQNTNKVVVNTIKSQLDALNDELKSNFEKHELLDTLSTLKDDLTNNQRQLIVDFKLSYQNSLTEILEKISLISKNTLQERETLHKNALTEINSLIDITNEKINNVLKENEKDSSLFQEQLKTNKKSFKKIIQELSDSIEETAKNIATNIEETIKEVEEKFVNTLRSSISESVVLSQNFRDELVENYDLIKGKTVDLVSTIDEKALLLINDTIKNSLSTKLSEKVNNIEETINPLVKDFNSKLELFKNSFLESNTISRNKLDSEIQKSLDEFLQDIEVPKEKLRSQKDTFPSQLGGMSNFLQEKISRFVSKVTQEFERNSNILETLTKEYLEKINELSEAELRQTISDNQELGEKIGSIVDKLSKGIIKESKNWEKIAQTIEKNLVDLSANINRRIELFITDTKTELNDNAKEVNDDLNSFLKQSDKLKEEFKEFSNQIISSLDEFSNKNEELRNSSLDLISNNKEFINSLKTRKLDKIYEEIEKISGLPLERFALAKQNFHSDLLDFSEDFKTEINNILDKNNNIIKDNESQLTDELIYAKNESKENLKNNQSNLDDTFTKITDQMNKTIDEAISNVTDSFKQLKKDIVNDLINEKEKFSSSYSGLYDSFDNILEKATQMSNQTLSTSNEAFSEYLSNFSNKLEEEIDGTKSKLDSIELNLKQSSDTTFKNISDQITEFIDDLGKNTEQSNESLVNSLLEILASSSEDMKIVQEQSETNVSNISDLLQKVQSAIQKTFSLIDERTKRVDTELNTLSTTNTETLDENFKSTSSLITSHLNGLINSAESKISSLEEEVKETTKSLISEADSKIGLQVEQLKSTLNEYTETKLETFRENIAQYNEKTKEYQTEIITLAHEISSNVHETFETAHNSFTDLINRFEVQLNSSIKKTKDNLNKLLNQTSNQIISEHIEPSIKATEKIGESLNSDLNLLKSNLMENIDLSLNSLASEIKEIENSTSDNIKTSFNEGNEKLTKLFDAYQSKLMIHESGEVQSLRQVAQKLIEPLDLIDTVISDRISGSINPYQENLEGILEQQKNQFNQNMKKLTNSYGNLLSDSKSLGKKLPEVLTQSLTSTDETIQDYHKVISSELTIYEEKFEETLDTNVSSNIEQGIEYLKQSHALYEKDSNELKEELTSFLTNVENQLVGVTNTTKGNVETFSNLVRTLSDYLMQENEQGQQFITDVKRFIAPDDLENNLTNLIAACSKRLNIVVPSVNIINDEMLGAINKKARIRIIISSSDSDIKTLEKIYKKKGNVTIFESKNPIPFILAFGEGSEIDPKADHAKKALFSIISDDEEKGTPGFEITNENMIEFFDKSIFVSLLKTAKSKLRETVA